MSIEESLRIVDKGDVAVIEFDLVGEKVNKLSTPVMTRLKELVAEIKGSQYKAMVFLSRKPKMFIAGADIEEIKSLKTKSDFMPALEEAHEIFNAIEDLPIPTVVAIHGPCLGGGCEMSLAFDYRIATDSEITKIGLPEVKLGIVPGFGGCVRLPRVVGLQASLDIILAGKAVPGKKAARIGLLDECVPEEYLEKRAMALADDIVKGKKKKRAKVFQPKGMMNQFLESFAGRGLVFSKAKKMLLAQSKGFYPAPLKALEIIKKTYGMKDRTRALKIEMEGFCEVSTTEISKHLIDLFFMLESIKRKSGVMSKVESVDVDHLAVLGAGTMGGGIAYVAADKGVDVRMKDINNSSLAVGFSAARQIWQKKLKRRRINKYQFEQKMNHISGSLDFSGFKNMDVVIEAVVEDMNIKKKVIEETVKHVDENCVIATNTSSLSVNEMAKAHPHPEKFLGMHFFNPVDKMPLVEVIRGEKTSDEAVATIFGLTKKMGKIPVVVKDGPGFLVNRLLLPYMAEAMFLLGEGMDVPTVDRYFTHSFGMPMGVFRLMDEVGLDVAVKVLKIFRDSLGDRVEISPLSEKILPSGRLGRKNGKGFYLYDEKGKETGFDPLVYKDLGLKNPTNPLSEKECVERCMLMMVNEASRTLLEDKIVESAEELDLAMIMGTGFPPFRGGLLKYADKLGSNYIVQELELYAARFGKRFQPSQPLVNMAKSDRTFY